MRRRLSAGTEAHWREERDLPCGRAAAEGRRLTLRCPFSPSGYAYTRPEAGNELDMDLGEEDAEEAGDAGDAESGSIEEERCVSSALRRAGSRSEGRAASAPADSGG